MRTFRVRPFLAGGALTCLTFLLVAYVGATAYLIFRDDLVGAAVSRQVSMQYAYEERIAALRAELDRLTSRHVVQTEGVEQQVARLLAQQEMIERRQAMLDGVIERATRSGVTAAAPGADAVSPGAAGGPADHRTDKLSYAPSEAASEDPISQLLSQPKPEKVSLGDGTVRPILARLRSSLDTAEDDLSTRLNGLATAADSEAERLSEALVPIGIALASAEPDQTPAQGGPLVSTEGLHFVERTALLTRALDDIDRLRETALAYPIGVPVKALSLSSRFGYRQDPFLKRRAFHTGLDFAAFEGTTVRATAPGVIVSAGWNGGYGQMVEVRHESGVSTRYGHLSKVLVKAGARVEAGTAIGLVGSTGRSTGPHLHYETRVDDEPVNPSPYLAAGKALRRTL